MPRESSHVERLGLGVATLGMGKTKPRQATLSKPVCFFLYPFRVRATCTAPCFFRSLKKPSALITISLWASPDQYDRAPSKPSGEHKHYRPQYANRH
jgi:hypothetical protein